MRKSGMLKSEKTWLCPDIAMYRDKEEENLVTEVALPGVRKEDIAIEAGEEGFCLKAKRDDAYYDSCFHFVDRVTAEKADAEFLNGLLKLRIPLRKESLRARRITIQ